jgi:hypothetical protein
MIRNTFPFVVFGGIQAVSFNPVIVPFATINVVTPLS